MVGLAIGRFESSQPRPEGCAQAQAEAASCFVGFWGL